MRDKEKVNGLLKQYRKIKEERDEEILVSLSETIFKRFEELLNKKLAVFEIAFSRNKCTDCINIEFRFSDNEDINKSIENRDILYIFTNVRYSDYVLESLHDALKEVEFIEEDLCRGAYNEDEVSFVINQL